MDADLIIIGSGAGGSAVARALARTGARILILERGTHVPREPQNWDAQEVFCRSRYVSADPWLDAAGRPFTPQVHYNVGGATKFYGAALFRFAPDDFTTWPVTCADMEPAYREAERWYNVHALPHVPAVAAFADVLTSKGLHPSPAPSGVLDGTVGACSRCARCDGFPCPVLGKADAETAALRRALRRPGVTLRTGACVQRIEAERGQARRVILEDGTALTAGAIVLAAGAVNSAALLLRSGLGGDSGQAGRNYMAHISTAMLAFPPAGLRHGLSPADEGFHKTLVMLDDVPELRSSLQMTGRPAGGMLRGESRLAAHLPSAATDALASRALGLWLMTEDSPRPGNAVTLTSSGRIRLSVTRDPQDAARARTFRSRIRRILHSAGYVTLSSEMPLAAVAHQCGTLRMGHSSRTSVVSPEGSLHDIPNLFVADASVFRSSSAVNPALTVIANAIRISPHIQAAIS